MELGYRAKEHLRFSRREQRDLLISILAITFIVAFDDKSESFDLVYWLLNFVKMFLIVFVSILLHELGHKIVALKIGLKEEYRMWPTGLAIGVIFALISGGKWWILLPGGVFLEHMAILRIGHFRYGLNKFSYGMVASAGPITNLLFATFFKTLALLGIMPEFFTFVAFFNLYYAVFKMLPIPNIDGIHMFFATRLVYIFIFGTLVGYILLYWLGFYSRIFVVIIGLVCYFAFYIVVERAVE